MADLIFCARCDQDVSHDGVYVRHGVDPLHRDCFIDRASDLAREEDGYTTSVAFALGLNFDPDGGGLPVPPVPMNQAAEGGRKDT